MLFKELKKTIKTSENINEEHKGIIDTILTTDKGFLNYITKTNFVLDLKEKKDKSVNSVTDAEVAVVIKGNKHFVEIRDNDLTLSERRALRTIGYKTIRKNILRKKVEG